MRFLALLLICSPLARAAPETLWQAKAEYFRAVLNGQDQAAAKARLEQLNHQRTEAALAEAMQGHYPELEKPTRYDPGMGFKVEELDMFKRSKELSDADKAKLVDIFHQSLKRLDNIRTARKLALADLARNPQHPQSLAEKARAIFQAELEICENSVEESAAVLTKAGVDRDYAYRAYLREHRRLGFQ